jgi:F0F1-type ATP synthase alpha subunit
LIEKNLAGWVRRRMAEYQRALEISQFGAELPVETQEILELGKRLEILFSQEPQTIIPQELQLLLVGLLVSGFWKDKSPIEMKNEVLKILKEYQEGNLPKLPEEIGEIRDLDHLQFLIKEILPEIEKIIYAYS